MKNEVLIDYKAVAEAIDEKLREAAVSIKDEWGVRLKLVELAYTHHGFSPNDSFQGYIDEFAAYAQGIGISYEIEKLDGNALQDLSDRLSALSRSDAVHGIRIKGWNLHRGEEDEWPYKHLEPHKDVECRTDLQAYAHLQGCPGPMIGPLIGAILEVLRITLASDYSNKTIAIVTGDQADKTIHSLAAILRNRRANIITCSPSNSEASRLIRSAHAVITAVGKPKYLNRDYVREGQAIIDLQGWRDEDGDADLADIEHLTPFLANRLGLFAIERRQPFVNMMKSFLLGRGNRGLQISLPLSRA